jgi:soluble lytic murein transglycosylase-like protein
MFGNPDWLKASPGTVPAMPKSGAITSKTDVQQAIIATVQSHTELDARTMMALTRIALGTAKQESGFNVNARGSSGEVGPMQLMPGTAKGLGVDANDPRQNIQGGVTLLLQLYREFHDWAKAAAVYNSATAGYNLRHGKGIPAGVLSSYVNPVMGNAAGTEIGTIIVQISGSTSMNHDELKAATRDGVKEAMGKNNARTLAQVGGGSH